jgi:hypothetical protein
MEVAYARRALEAGASGFVLKQLRSGRIERFNPRCARRKTLYLTTALTREVLNEIQRDPKALKDPCCVADSQAARGVRNFFAEGRSAKKLPRLWQSRSAPVEFHKLPDDGGAGLAQ